ncbi:MAG: hypothetical protein PG978_000996 [Wolbachia endosymbiont of Ctenocephalides felis wCfeF]|nr:MAG: hypothetical protein PG978_000996 [Wolbachia endosymbiont of Ctenocephalides felis wCfeF]
MPYSNKSQCARITPDIWKLDLLESFGSVSDEAKKLLDNLRQSSYNRVVGVLGLKFIFNLVLSDKSTV